VLRHPVKSSNLKSVGYDKATRTLQVEFHSGQVRDYKHVPSEHHAGLLAAKSPGAYFHTHIKNHPGVVVSATP